jgi:hypothetical protein
VKQGTEDGKVSRRKFVAIASAAGVVAIAGTACPRRGNRAIAYKRSGRGLHVSNAAKKHNANMLYSTFAAATADMAHPGDNSKVVMVTISRNLHSRLFSFGKTSADLRHEM